MTSQIPDTKEKLGSALAYLTLGMWGLVWLLISRTPAYAQKDFVRFHCFQSIFIGILYMFVPSGVAILFSLLTQVFSLIPGTSFINQILHVLHGSLQSLITFFGLMLIVYCIVFSLFGKFTNIPYISQAINRMLR